MRSIKAAAIKRPARRRKAVTLGVLLVMLSAGAGLGWYFWLGPGQPAEKAAASTTPQTYTATVRRGDLSISSSGSGTLAAGQAVDLSFSTSGLVTELNVQLGDTVQAGDVLARLAPSSSLEAALADAQLARLQAQQSLNELQQNASLSLAQAYQNLLKAQSTYQDAEFANARLAYSRCSESVAKRLQQTLERAAEKLAGLASEKTSQAYIDAEGDYATALANSTACAYSEADKISVNAAYETASLALQKAEDTYNILNTSAGIDPGALALAEAKLSSAAAQVANAEEALSGLTLTATIGGKVTYLAGGAGSLAGSSKFITISNVSQPVLNISVGDNDIEKLVVGSHATVVFDALPEQTFRGTVTQVDPSLTTSGQYKIAKGLLALDEASAAAVQNLPLGLSATVTIISQETKDALLVPVIALKALGEGQYAVMRVASDGKLSLAVVEVGINDGETAEILNGLNPGDVVTTGTAQAAASSSSDSELPADAGIMVPPDGGMPPDGGGALMP